MMKKLFNHGGLVRWNTIDKETVDEILFKASNPRNRIILELTARGGMRIGEVGRPRAGMNGNTFSFPRRRPTG